MALLLPAYMQDGALVFATGVFTVIIGLTIIAAHHHFTTLSAIVISIVGIAATLKGVWLMIAPQWGAALTAATVRSPVLVLAAMALVVVGAWLSYVGWAAGVRTGTAR